MKILIVDDEPLFLKLINGHLKSVGYHDTHNAASGAEALAMIDSSEIPFDCFLLDIRMPGMSGVDLCRNIRAVPGYAATPIVIITSMMEKSYIDDAFQAGANDYVIKPIDRLEISARMGMVEALVAERTQSGLLSKQLDDAETAGIPKTDFSTPITLQDADRLMPFSSLENYTLRLGNMRLFSSAAIGFHIIQGAEIYTNTSALEFSDILTEVALAINDVIVTDNYLMAYAGDGDFCGIFPRLSRVGWDEVELMINDQISRRLHVLHGSNVPIPLISVGSPQSGGLFSFRDPTYMLFQAIVDASSKAVGANQTTGVTKGRGRARV